MTKLIQLLNQLVSYIDAKAISTHVLPALVTLASEQKLNVKYANIYTFNIVV